MGFRVGQKVVRIASENSTGGRHMSSSEARRRGWSYPNIGDVVTIKTLNVWTTGVILTFYEHDNSHIQRQLDEPYEPGFGANHFRPLVERKTNISVFTAMLNTSKQEQDA